jgi:hypothetical protein
MIEENMIELILEIEIILNEIYESLYLGIIV